ncbi:MAG: hypothetical protein K5879_08370 [Lachnospiraceae bacterium]|nr:hypothetical protein [Lachnospiraceae bacterium]
MIDFETELKKFHPSLELKDAEEAIGQHDLADMIDLIVKTVKEGETSEPVEPVVVEQVMIEE